MDDKLLTQAAIDALLKQAQNAAARPEPEPEPEPEPPAAPPPPPPVAAPADAPAPAAAPPPPMREVLAPVPVELAVVLGEVEMAVADVLRLGARSTIVLETLAGAPVEIRLQNYTVARGQVVTVGDEYGIRIVETLVAG